MKPSVIIWWSKLMVPAPGNLQPSKIQLFNRQLSRLLSLWRPSFFYNQLGVEATEQYFPVVLFIMLYKVVLTFESLDEILKSDPSLQLKANEQYFPLLYQVVPTFESVDEIICSML